MMRLLCKIGIHKWKYSTVDAVVTLQQMNSSHTRKMDMTFRVRTCECCLKRQRRKMSRISDTGMMDMWIPLPYNKREIRQLKLERILEEDAD